MKKDDFEIDYKQLCEDAGKMLKNMWQQQNLYFELLTRITKSDNVIGTVSRNILKMNMTDQIKYLKVVTLLIEVCTELNEKYGFDDATEVEE